MHVPQDYFTEPSLVSGVHCSYTDVASLPTPLDVGTVQGGRDVVPSLLVPAPI